MYTCIDSERKRKSLSASGGNTRQYERVLLIKSFADDRTLKERFALTSHPVRPSLLNQRRLSCLLENVSWGPGLPARNWSCRAQTEASKYFRLRCEARQYALRSFRPPYTDGVGVGSRSEVVGSHAAEPALEISEPIKQLKHIKNSPFHFGAYWERGGWLYRL